MVPNTNSDLKNKNNTMNIVLGPHIRDSAALETQTMKSFNRDQENIE